MIQKDSVEYKLLMKKLKLSKMKSNRDYLCLRCWKVFTYEQVKVHRQEKSSHIESIITSKHFASEEKFLSVSKSFNKMKVVDGNEYYESPYCDKFKGQRQRKSSNKFFIPENTKMDESSLVNNKNSDNKNE